MHSSESIFIMPEAGYSLFELIATLCIMAIVAVIAVPSLVDLSDSFQRNNGRQELGSAITRARTEAIARGARGVLKATADGRSFTFGIDYPPYNPALEEDSVEYIRDLPGQVSITIDQPIVFNSQGYLIDVSGEYQQLNFSLLLRGESFCKGNIFPLGSLEYGC